MQVTKTDSYNGSRWVIQFGNGFGLSVIDNEYSCGLEAGLLKKGYEGLVYDGKKFIDIIGYLTQEELLDLMEWTSSLPADYQVSNSMLDIV
jgi:hypothetical protein